MNLTSNFDKLHKGNKEDASKTDDSKGIEHYAISGPGPVRNLCFIQPNGDRLFLNYAYLIAGAFSAENNVITLSYTSHSITLKGRHLGDLFESLMAQTPRQIACLEKRYIETREETETVVTEIVIQAEG